MNNTLKIPDIPNVLLLGSGLDQTYGGLSWAKFLSAIATKEYSDKEKIKSLKCAEPLKAILITDDTIDKTLKEKRKMLMQTVDDEKYIAALKSILEMGFDDILTTNYTYELESLALSPKKVNDRNIRPLRKHLKNEKRYNLHTYNEVRTGEYCNRVWHVHGEAACYGGMILGHYYYGNLLSRIHDYVNDHSKYFKNKLTNNKNDKPESWIDSFIMGDVFVVGFGFGLSELDFWWLLNRKAREKEKTGKIYFYEPKLVQSSEKIMLLKTLKNQRGENLVEVIDLNYKMVESKNKYELDGEWKDFYNCVINDISTRIKGEN